MSCCPLPATVRLKPAWLTGVCSAPGPLAGEGGVIWDTSLARLAAGWSSRGPHAWPEQKAAIMQVTRLRNVVAFRKVRQGPHSIDLPITYAGCARQDCMLCIVCEAQKYQDAAPCAMLGHSAGCSAVSSIQEASCAQPLQRKRVCTEAYTYLASPVGIQLLSACYRWMSRPGDSSLPAPWGWPMARGPDPPPPSAPKWKLPRQLAAWAYRVWTLAEYELELSPMGHLIDAVG